MTKQFYCMARTTNIFSHQNAGSNCRRVFRTQCDSWLFISKKYRLTDTKGNAGKRQIFWMKLVILIHHNFDARIQLAPTLRIPCIFRLLCRRSAINGSIDCVFREHTIIKVIASICYYGIFYDANIPTVCISTSTHSGHCTYCFVIFACSQMNVILKDSSEILNYNDSSNSAEYMYVWK